MARGALFALRPARHAGGGAARIPRASVAWDSGKWRILLDKVGLFFHFPVPLVQFPIAILMVFERGDILVAKHGRHPHIRSCHGHDAAVFEDAPRLELVTKTRERLLEVAMPPWSPSLRRGEKSVL